MTDTSTATGADAAAQAAAAAAATAQAAADQQAAADAAAAAGQQGNDGEPWADPEKARKEIERLRREAGDARINAKKAAADEARRELLEQITKAVDPNAADGAQLTPEQLQAAIAQRDTELESARNDGVDLRRQNAALLEAWKQGVDPKKVGYLNYTLTQRADFKALDVAADDFSSKLADVIKATITEDSSLKLSGAAVGTGAEQFGGANGATAITKEQFANMTVAEKSAMFKNNRSEFDRLTAL
jgi:hypothetical protein